MAENNTRAWHAVLTKGSAALKKRLTLKHGDKPEFQKILKSTGQDKETWYKMHLKKQARLRGEDPESKEKERKEIGLKAWGATKGARMGGEEGGGLTTDAPKAGKAVVGQYAGAGPVKTLSVAEYMKQKEEEQRREKAKAILAARTKMNEEKDVQHLIGITVSHPELKSAEPIFKKARVRASSEEEAIKKVESHYRKAGYKVHPGTFHHSTLTFNRKVDEGMTKAINKKMKNTLSAMRGRAAIGEPEKGLSWQQNKAKAIKAGRAMAKEEVEQMEEGTVDLTKTLVKKIKAKGDTAYRSKKTGLLTLRKKSVKEEAEQIDEAGFKLSRRSSGKYREHKFEYDTEQKMKNRPSYQGYKTEIHVDGRHYKAGDKTGGEKGAQEAARHASNIAKKTGKKVSIHMIHHETGKTLAVADHDNGNWKYRNMNEGYKEDIKAAPFDTTGARKVKKTYKDKYGNVVKNIAKHLAKKGMAAAMKKEEAEQIDERGMVGMINKIKAKSKQFKDGGGVAAARSGPISPEHKAAYVKAGRDAQKLNPSQPKGSFKALAKEEAEQINELKRDTLISYVSKARAKNIKDSAKNRLAGIETSLSDMDKASAKTSKRSKGIQRAYDRLNMKEALDKVGKETADIDNDKDVDKTDMYLHNRRGAIKKAIAKKKLSEGKAAAAADKAIALQRGKGNKINRKPTMKVDMKSQASPPETHSDEDNSANVKV